MTPLPDHQAFLLTPPGAGAIAVIRVTGTQPAQVVARIFRGKDGTTLTDAFGDWLLYGRVVDGDEVIDDALVSLGSRSTEVGGKEHGSVVDISCHGGVRVVERILQALESQGVTVRHGAGSELSLWPALNLIEREAIGAALVSKTQRAVQFAARLRTNLARRLDELANRLPIDPDSAGDELETLIKGYPAAKVLLNGATVALIGPPNSGKSTLFNRLVGRPAAVTSPIPGTTRDWIAEDVEVEGIPITLVDTAGRHSKSEELERQAVESGVSRSQSASVILLVLDSSCSLGASEKDLLAECPTVVPMLVVANKSDLECKWGLADLHELQPSFRSELVRVSALSGFDCDALANAILKALGLTEFDDANVCLFTDRQVLVARAALSALEVESAAMMIREELIGR